MRMPDVNVLVGAHRVEAPDHLALARVVTTLVDGAEPFALSELVLSAFLRIVTHRTAFATPTPLDAALDFVDQLVNRPNVVLVRPGLEHFNLFSRLVRETRATGKLVPDAYHAALAIEHGCEWLSCDGDFMRFKGLRVRHPLRS